MCYYNTIIILLHNFGTHLLCDSGMYLLGWLLTNVGEVMEKLVPFYTVGRNEKWYSSHGKQYGVSSKQLKIEISIIQQSHL